MSLLWPNRQLELAAMGACANVGFPPPQPELAEAPAGSPPTATGLSPPTATGLRLQSLPCPPLKTQKPELSPTEVPGGHASMGPPVELLCKHTHTPTRNQMLPESVLAAGALTLQ